MAWCIAGSVNGATEEQEADLEQQSGILALQYDHASAIKGVKIPPFLLARWAEGNKSISLSKFLGHTLAIDQPTSRLTDPKAFEHVLLVRGHPTVRRYCFQRIEDTDVRLATFYGGHGVFLLSDTLQNAAVTIPCIPPTYCVTERRSFPARVRSIGSMSL